MKKTGRHISIEIIPETDQKGYYVVVPSLPGCFSQGRTIEEARLNAAHAIKLHLRELAKSGESPFILESFHTTIPVDL